MVSGQQKEQEVLHMGKPLASFSLLKSCDYNRIFMFLVTHHIS